MQNIALISLYAAALTGAALVTPHAAAADTDTKVARIAYVAGDYASSSSRGLQHLRNRLHELGWIEGQNLVLDEYWGEGDMARLPELMRQALAQHLDVLVTSSTPGALAAKNASSTTPIVVASMGDPVATGVVSNMARPGGNLTAFSTG